MNRTEAIQQPAHTTIDEIYFMPNQLITRRVSFYFSSDLLEQIDEICKKNFISKSKWFIDASIHKLEKATNQKIDKVVRGVPG